MSTALKFNTKNIGMTDKLIKDGVLASGSSDKILGANEIADREWRADPIDGLRPLKKTC